MLDRKTSLPSLWEVSADGTGLHPLLPGWNTSSANCCGNWTPDGKYYVFESTSNDKAEIWAIRDRRPLVDFWRRSSNKPFQLTSGQLSSHSPVLSPDGKKLYVLGQLLRGEAQRWDEKSQQWVQAGAVYRRRWSILAPMADGYPMFCSPKARFGKAAPTAANASD